MAKDERISVEEAARRLNLSPRAVRFRIERGELQGVKVGQAWQVVWENDSAGGNQTSAKGNERDAKRHLASASGSEAAGSGNGRKRFPFRGNENGRFSSASGNQATAGGTEEETGKITYAKELSSLAAFRILRGVFERVPATPECERHRRCLHGALREVTRGYYQWRRDAKLRCYNEARNWVADAMLEFILSPLPDAGLTEELVRELEHDALAALVGLSRRFERKGRKDDGDEPF